MTHLYLIHGFAGAGKTTFARKLQAFKQSYEDCRLG